MGITIEFGGWGSDRPVATGVSTGISRFVGWLDTVNGKLRAAGTGGRLSPERCGPNVQKSVHGVSADLPRVVDERRTPAEDLAHIREILHPAVSDLAATLNVSRQSVYNWLNGERVADENALRLRDLAQAADVFADEGISVNAAFLKRKFANGRTLLQVVAAGGSARDAALLFVQIHRIETAQRERIKARSRAHAKSPATADFDFPAAND
jgi:transcriptional regulator with XRE-family HTH domain